MAPISRGLKAALTSLILWPAIGTASPILIPGPWDPSTLYSPVVGWTNTTGNFAVGDFSNVFAGGGTISYSTASSLLSYQSNYEGFLIGGTNVSGGGAVSVDTEISAIVQDNGTATGNLLGGTLVVKAGADGIPQLGAAPGQALVVGYAIDSAAVPFVDSVAMLFDLTYTIPALAGLGDYLTFLGAQQIFYPHGVYEPWSVSGSTSGNMEDGFYATYKLPEPSTYVLMLLALGAMGLATRRRKRAVS